MLRLALLTARTRPGSFAGALLAFAMSAVLVMAGGMLLQAALRTHPPVERYAAAAAVIAGDQITGADHDVELGERVRVPRVADIAAARQCPAYAPRSRTSAFRLASAGAPPRPTTGAPRRLAPYVLTAGRAPRQPNEIVTGYRAKLGARLDALFDRAGTPGHRRGNRPPAARRAGPQGDLPVRYGGGTARRPSRPRRCDRRSLPAAASIRPGCEPQPATHSFSRALRAGRPSRPSSRRAGRG